MNLEHTYKFLKALTSPIHYRFYSSVVTLSVRTALAGSRHLTAMLVSREINLFPGRSVFDFPKTFFVSINKRALLLSIRFSYAKTRAVSYTHVSRQTRV